MTLASHDFFSAEQSSDGISEWIKVLPYLSLDVVLLCSKVF